MNTEREFGIYLLFGPDWTYDAYRKIVKEAELLGFDAAWHQDNLTGHFPIPRDLDSFDVWTLLPALASETESIRLGPMATPAIRRNAALLAFASASLDVISNGRLNIGLGSGDDRHQYEMIGMRFPDTGKERRQILREAIQVMKLLWEKDGANFDGEHYHLRDAQLTMKPMQKPNPPIYIACSTSRRMMPRIAAKQGNGLAVMWGHDETVSVTVKAFQEEWQAHGRDPDEYAAVRSSAIIFCEDEDPEKARDFYSRLSSIPRKPELLTSPAKVPEGSDSDMYLIGKPSTIVDKLKERVFDLGFNQIMTHFAVCDDIDIDTSELPGHPGNYLAGMRIFAEEVLSHLKT